MEGNSAPVSQPGCRALGRRGPWGNYAWLTLFSWTLIIDPGYKGWLLQRVAYVVGEATSPFTCRWYPRTGFRVVNNAHLECKTWVGVVKGSGMLEYLVGTSQESFRNVFFRLERWCRSMLMPDWLVIYLPHTPDSGVSNSSCRTSVRRGLQDVRQTKHLKHSLTGKLSQNMTNWAYQTFQLNYLRYTLYLKSSELHLLIGLNSYYKG